MTAVSNPMPQPVPMFDFSRQFGPLRQEILDALARVCDSQHFILGPQVAAFEAAAATACDARYAIGCANGTDALWLALAAAGVGDSSTATPSNAQPAAVITSPFSFFATASSILRAGAHPVFADIDPRTFNLSSGSVAEILNGPTGKSVKAILPVHLFGQCADWDGFAALQRDHPGLLLIEDAAQAFGGAWNGSPAGSLGDAAAFSFYPTKNLAAMGDAGLVTTSNPEIDRRARSLRAHGMTRRYYHDEMGANSRLDEMQAAVLNVKLRYIADWNQKRRERAALYDQLFREAGLVAESTAEGVVLPYSDPRATAVFHQYVIRAPRRDALRAHLTAQQIGSDIYYPVPLHLQAALKDLGYKPGDFPHAERASAEVLALPLYPELRDDEQRTVVGAIRDFYS
ncbi:MAG TPA: DegT/DnrJ/EryC1/StrS family aminotransferase [Acidobacteriaceae bacterium]|nr:DegT/DnrJ/EryC1/StrS family aminotransferase [Acidobacteriaceae bacterium]